MGKLKNALIEFEEQREVSRKILRDAQGNRNHWVYWGIANDQDWAQYEAEFNAWLDAYEKSFGQGGSHD